MNYRALTKIEIEQLKSQHCQAESWQYVQVGSEFNTNTIWHSNFSGQVKLASFNKVFEMSDGSKKHAGIYHAHIHNCTIGANVYIAQVKNRIANCDIEDGVYIEAINSILAEGESFFGNGTSVAVLDETGSRTIKIFAGLSAQSAYFQAIYKHSIKSSMQLARLIDSHCESLKSTRAQIGSSAYIVNCGTIKNTIIGPYAKFDGLALLENATIESSEKAPSIIGSGVIARDFIMATGSVLTDAVQIERCYIGQGSVLSKQFSAIDSVFFANCQAFHGEAVSVFAGPYTVTHHKSTLLIGGMFSFFNAGSGSNQSNHMYKLGPIHYGVVDRGSKMASDSYIPWPSRVGCFSVIMGKHKNKLDSSSFPFSYVIADGTCTNLIPGINLQSIGTFRDAAKWQSRDMRTDSNHLDLIEWRLFNPYVISQVVNGLCKLKAISGLIKDPYFPADNLSDNISIKDSSVQRGIELYQMALDLYLGDAVLSRLEANKSIEITKQALISWVDMAGSVYPLEQVQSILAQLSRNEINSYSAFEYELKNAAGIVEMEWAFVSALLMAEYGICNTKQVLSRWIDAKRKLEQLILTDAKKEFADNMQTCFGLDQQEFVRTQEFSILRGEASTHAFVQKFQNDTAIAIAKAEAYL